MIDKLLTRTGIGIALFLMVLELTYINAKSLFYLVNEFSDVDRVFSIIGSLAFSMVTVIVMRKSTEKWAKIAFPLFDALLVFLGLNLRFYDSIISGTDNEVRLWLTVFMALFTGFITYSLGIINYKEHSTEINSDKSEIEKYKTQINSLQSDIEELSIKINSLKSINTKLASKMEDIKSEFNGKESDLIKYKGIALQAERSRILKKKAENRTIEEIEILNN